MCKHLLIDAKNMLYRAVYVAAYDKKFKSSKHHNVNIVLHFLNNYFIKLRPEQIHIFWDSPRSQTWRKQICPSYKEGRNGSNKISAEEVSESVNELIEVCMFLFKHMGFKQYWRPEQEADDLIYAFCKLNSNDTSVIISSDKDLLQIIYRFPNVRLHSHLSKSDNFFEEVPKLDPVILKCLVGDKSDNIEGYYKVGPVTASVLVEDAKARFDFFNSEKAIAKISGEIEQVGNRKFRDNLNLVDLSLNPYLLDNIMYISDRQFQEIKFDLSEIRNIISKYKLRGVTADISRYISPFKELVRGN